MDIAKLTMGSTTDCAQAERPILITRGAGFVGSHLVRRMVQQGHKVINLDKLTYADGLESLRGVSSMTNHRFEYGDVSDRGFLQKLLADLKPDKVFHLAAANHVDRLIDAPADFINANIVGMVLDEMERAVNGRPHADQITYVDDRPGHYYRYAIDCGRTEAALHWRAATRFDEGLRRAVDWYLNNFERLTGGKAEHVRLGLSGVMDKAGHTP